MSRTNESRFWRTFRTSKIKKLTNAPVIKYQVRGAGVYLNEYRRTNNTFLQAGMKQYLSNRYPLVAESHLGVQLTTFDYPPNYLPHDRRYTYIIAGASPKLALSPSFDTLISRSSSRHLEWPDNGLIKAEARSSPLESPISSGRLLSVSSPMLD